MKNFKRFASVVMVIMMMLSMMIPAMAQDVTLNPADADNASITISNASKGETYKIYKLFDATVTGNEDGGSIAYTGDIPDALAAYFEKDNVGNISLKKGVDEDEMFAALAGWAATAEATATAESDGSVLVFSGLAYGYYVVTTTQGESAITVTSTNPNATIYDKNSSAPVTNPSKSADDEDVNIGDTVTYTITFGTANFVGEGKSAKQIVSYTIEDTLPAFLTNVNVTSIIIDNDPKNTKEDNSDLVNVTKQFTDKKITIDWVDENGNSLYANGATITITYTAVVTDDAAIDGEGNKNEVTISYKDEDDKEHKYEINVSETIYTYAIALKKVDQSGDALAGATFQFPFYVKETPATDGAYIYAGTTTGEGLTNKITTPENGVIIVKGVASGKYSITETKAPDGYNMLTAPVEVTATKTESTTTNTTFYLDEDGNVVASATDTTKEVKVEIDKLAATAVLVVNKTGTELPSTGGIGTTIFYCSGAILALGAFVLLVTKKRMSHEG